MEPATMVAAPHFLKILGMVLNLGPIGLVLVFWYFDKQKTDDVIRSSNEKTNEILRKYSEDMHEMRGMYVTNASLVKRYADLADDLKDIITLSTQVQTQLVDRIKQRGSE